MKHIVRKVFFDFEKEEQFLNEMSTKGLALTSYSWCKYEFEVAPKGEYIYRLELLDHPVEQEESQKYINFIEDTGAELVTSYHRWVYLRKKTSDGEFSIFSDMTSKIKHFERIRAVYLVALLCNLVAAILNLVILNTTTINLYAGTISLTVVFLIFLCLFLPITKKINRLNSEKQIRE